MGEKIDERLPREIGEGALPSHAAIKSPWEKLMSYHDAAHYAQRYSAVVGASIMQAFRILMPDYVQRATALCENAYARLNPLFCGPYGPMSMDEHNVHPFCRGNFPGGLAGDSGDDKLLMCGRVNDFGTYRVEKELDVCYWDIIGSELCRSTTQSLQGVADGMASHLQPGPKLEYHMVEAKGCGDLHCRIVAENRGKFPMPEHEQWECFGPVGSADQIRFTPEEDMVKESQAFREECDYRFVNGTCLELDSTSYYPFVTMSNGSTYILPTIDAEIKKGTLDEEFVNHVLRCVCEAAGKSAFGEFYAKEAFRNWVGAPNDVDDGRLMGAHIEMFLQSMRIPFEIEAFNAEEVVCVIDRKAMENYMPKIVDAYIATWYGMTKTLVSARWSLWEEDSPEGKVRIRIAKKIDKFC